jgi:hypothetical protein
MSSWVSTPAYLPDSLIRDLSRLTIIEAQEISIQKAALLGEVKAELRTMGDIEKKKVDEFMMTYGSRPIENLTLEERIAEDEIMSALSLEYSFMELINRKRSLEERRDLASKEARQPRLLQTMKIRKFLNQESHTWVEQQKKSNNNTFTWSGP